MMAIALLLIRAIGDDDDEMEISARGCHDDYRVVVRCVGGGQRGSTDVVKDSDPGKGCKDNESCGLFSFLSLSSLPL
jgi:hypothetical protein